MNTIGSKVINAILENERINANMLAEKIGIPRTQPIYDLINSKIKKVSSNYADKILSAFPHYNYNWLLTGEGSMLREKEIGSNHFRGDGNSYINVGSGTLSQNAKETNSEMYVKRIAELEEENKELRHKIDKLTADLLKSKERIIELLERE